MTKIKNALRRFTGWKHAWLMTILVASMVLHLGLIWYPKDLVLDEQYYVVAARDYLVQGDLHQPEHPPLGKVIITTGMEIFGDNPFGWRIMPALFGVGSIFFFYLILRQLKLSSLVTNLATGLFAFENVTFTMASVAMLDIFNVFFMLAGLWAYLARKIYPLAILFLVLCTLVKLTGLLGIVIIGIHWLVFRRDKALQLAISGLVAYVLAILAVPVMEFALTGEWSNPLTRAAQLFTIPATITFANSSHPSALHPYQWVTWYHVMPFWWTPQYMAAVTPTVWAATIPVFVWTSWVSWRRRNEAAVFAAAWIFATLILWIIIGGITNRITYIFYFTPIVGGIILGLALFIDKAKEWAKKPRQLLLTMGDKAKFKERFRAWSRRRNWLKWLNIGIVLFMAVHIISFWVFSPFNWIWPVIHP